MRKKNALWMSLVIPLIFSIAIAQVGAQELPVVEVDPAYVEVANVGDPCIMNITVTDVTNCAGWQFALIYPNSILNGTWVPGYNWTFGLIEGPFLKDHGTTFLVVSDYNDTGWNSTHGLMYVGCTLIPPVGVDGSGVLATINFTTVGSGGPYRIDLYDDEVILSDPEGVQIPCTVEDGSVKVIPEFPAAILIPLFMVVTLVAIILRNKAWLRKRSSPFLSNRT